MGGDYGEESAKVVSDRALNQRVHAVVVSQDEWGGCSVVLLPKGEKDFSKSVNAHLIKEGYGAINRDEDVDDWPGYLQEWIKMEEQAKEEKLRIWKHGGISTEDDYD
jgi:endonuclease YncB( thermonuclease family)